MRTSNIRKVRAYSLLAQGKVDKISDFAYRVWSQSQSGVHYIVIREGLEWKCECPDFTVNRVVCKHIHAVEQYRLNEQSAFSFEEEGEPRDLSAARALAQNRYQFQWWALFLIDARPVGSTEARPREGKKGADEGVDGWLRFVDKSEGHYEKIVVQVKSGHVGVKDIRELRDVISRQKAAIGIFVTLEEPTSEMIREVKATDPYVSPLWKHEYPKIQILTIEQLLKGERPKTPPTVNLFQEADKVKKADRTIETKLM